MVPAAPIDEQRRSSVRDIERLILSRIARGQYAVGSRLSSCHALGRELGANRNTINTVYQSLARQGYAVSKPGLGTFVAKRPPRTWDDDREGRVRDLLEHAIVQASLFGLSAEEFEALALETVRLHARRARIRVGYVDCNRSDARQLARELEGALSVPVEPLVVEDIAARNASGAGGFDLLGVNLAHVGAVERRLRRLGDGGRTAVVPIVALPDADTLTQVARLPAGTRLLTISDTEEILHTLTGLARGVNPSADVSGVLSSDPGLADALGGADAALVTRTAERRVEAVARDVPTIVAEFKLDEQSVRQLDERLAAALHPDTGTAPNMQPGLSPLAARGRR